MSKGSVMRRLVVGVALLTPLSSPATAGPSRYDEREAATALFKRTLSLVGASAYCLKNAGANQGLTEATVEWNKRHKAILERIVALLQATGDLSNAEKDEIDKGGYKEVQAAMSPRSACGEHQRSLEKGHLDLAVAPDTRDLYAVVQRASLVAGRAVWIVLTMADEANQPLQMTFHNPSKPTSSMAECRSSLPSLKTSLVETAREKESRFKAAKFVRVECILSTDDPLRPG